MNHVRIKTTKMKSFHLEAVIKSLPVKAVKQIRCGSLHLEAVIESFLMKADKTIRFLYFGGIWLAESF